MESVFKALYSFFSQFAPAYAEGAIPTEAEMPYIVYSISVPELFESTVLTASIYSKSNGFLEAVGIAGQISRAVKICKKLPLEDGGSILLYQGSPFVMNVGNYDERVRQLYLNIQIAVDKKLF